MAGEGYLAGGLAQGLMSGLQFSRQMALDKLHTDMLREQLLYRNAALQSIDAHRKATEDTTQQARDLAARKQAVSEFLKPASPLLSGEAGQLTAGTMAPIQSLSEQYPDLPEQTPPLPDPEQYGGDFPPRPNVESRPQARQARDLAIDQAASQARDYFTQKREAPMARVVVQQEGAGTRQAASIQAQRDLFGMKQAPQAAKDLAPIAAIDKDAEQVSAFLQNPGELGARQGVGFIGSRLPEWSLTTEGKHLKEILTRMMLQYEVETLGKRFNEAQLEQAITSHGFGKGATRESLLIGAKRLLDNWNNVSALRKAGYPPEVLAMLRARGAGDIVIPPGGPPLQTMVPGYNPPTAPAAPGGARKMVRVKVPTGGPDKLVPEGDPILERVPPEWIVR